MSQHLTRNDLEKLVERVDTSSIKLTKRMYILNGVPYDSKGDSLDSMLARVDLFHVVDLSIMTCRGQSLTWEHCDPAMAILLVTYAEGQKTKAKRKLLGELRNQYFRVHDAEHHVMAAADNCPVFYIDQQLVPPNEIRARLRRLSVNRIMYISRRGGSLEGEGAETGFGVARVWLK